MDSKTILIAFGLIFLLLYGCGVSNVQQGVSVVQAGIADVTNVDPDATMNPACIQAAKQQLSPEWANMTRIERFTMGLKVATTCADGEGK